MLNKTEQQERNFLKVIKELIRSTVDKAYKEVSEMSKDLQELKEYLWDNKDGMDRMEKEAVRMSINQNAKFGEDTVKQKSKLVKLIDSPYFARIDFLEDGKNEIYTVYIGIHSFFDIKNRINLIHDWRAPISSMFYDFELGKAHYYAPNGKIDGNISLKRQYRIRKGKMEFMLETSFNVFDDILQKELSVSSDEKMQNIVATIQRDQNKIIRNQSAQTLIIQGVAGSGKTSIALHRIAFLLYKFKSSLKSEDILIISPNKVFSNYISNVLPELGEDMIPQTGMDELAAEILGDKFKFQTHAEQIASLLEKDDDKLISRIRIKTISDFIEEIDNFATYVENNYFSPTDIQIDDIKISRSTILNKYQSYRRIPPLVRNSEVAKALGDFVKIKYKTELKKSQQKKLETALKKMYKTLNLKEIYKEFYDWLDMSEHLKLLAKSVYEYTDIFPLIYLKFKLEGFKAKTNVKHLLVDEMQDYSSIQYMVLKMLFPCQRTILGDSNQSVNPYSLTNAFRIKKVFDDATIMKLNKSYRSTFEITEFAQKISPNDSLEAVERHGEEPIIHECENHDVEFKKIEEIIKQFKSSEYNSMGVICKTQKEAEDLFTKIEKIDSKAYLLNFQSTIFYNGIIVTTAYMAKGLEFDCVVVPSVDNKNYKKDIDKNMLYVACTRAMHKLDLTFSGKKSEFLK